MPAKTKEKTTYEICSKIPVPEVARQQQYISRKYPYDKLAVGEMFFIPHRTKNNLSTHTSTVGKLLKRKFVTRLTHMVQKNHGWVLCSADTSGAVLGIGVWRVA